MIFMKMEAIRRYIRYELLFVLFIIGFPVVQIDAVGGFSESAPTTDGPD